MSSSHFRRRTARPLHGRTELLLFLISEKQIDQILAGHAHLRSDLFEIIHCRCIQANRDLLLELFDARVLPGI
jgi:hypothetical protein